MSLNLIQQKNHTNPLQQGWAYDGYQFFFAKKHTNLNFKY